MRFKGTLILLLVCIGIGCFIYFYEIKGGEEREKAKEAESRFWMIEGKDIQQIELPTPEGPTNTNRCLGSAPVIRSKTRSTPVNSLVIRRRLPGDYRFSRVRYYTIPPVPRTAFRSASARPLRPA